MSRVFVIQDTLRRDRDSGELVSKFDFSAAERFGKVEFLLSSSQKPFESSIDAVIQTLKERLADFTEDDYLLLVGNPILIGLTVAIASKVTNGRVKMLQWSSGIYVAVEANIDDDEHVSTWRNTWRSA